MKTEIKKTIETDITYIISYEEIEKLILDHLKIRDGETIFYWNAGYQNICRLKVVKTENADESEEEKEWYECWNCHEIYEKKNVIIEKASPTSIIKCPICTAVQ